MMPNWVIKGFVICKTVYRCVSSPTMHFEVEKRLGLSPVCAFLSVSNISIKVTKGDIKLQSNNREN